MSMFTTTRLFSCSKSTTRAFNAAKPYRSFSTFTALKMPEALKKEEVERGQDPSVAKQYDDETPFEQKFEDFYGMADGMKISMLSTYRNGVGVGIHAISHQHNSLGS